LDVVLYLFGRRSFVMLTRFEHKLAECRQAHVASALGVMVFGVMVVGVMACWHDGLLA